MNVSDVLGKIPMHLHSIIDYPSLNEMQFQIASEVLNTNSSLIICAPTGSGKTTIFELTLSKLLADAESEHVYEKPTSIYLAPLKSLCSERMSAWQNKFNALNYTCLELTTDTPMYDVDKILQSSLLITTPEKIESMFRTQSEFKQFFDKLKLVMIDEIHTISERGRGAVLEVVLSRLKASNPRIVAVSATCPNISDIADWLSTGDRQCLCRSFGSQFRPVPIKKLVLGFRKSQKCSVFQFDQFLTKKLIPLIRLHSNGRPTLIFSITRKTVENTAESLANAGFISGNMQQELINRISRNLLRSCLERGVGFHHAGIDPLDRRIIEQAFIEGCIPVLVSTSTLAMGINLPAHLVIIKNTMQYIGGETQEYPNRQMLQMIGRAGRPQYDTSGTAIIMTTFDKKEKYEHWLEEAENVESSLHFNLKEHLNTEIVLGNINTKEEMQAWISSTFLAIRLQKNPRFYGIQNFRSSHIVNCELHLLGLSSLEELEKLGAITISSDRNKISPLGLGKLMCEYYLDASTMSTFLQLTGSEKMIDLIHCIAGSSEMNDISIRQMEKNALNQINKGTGVQKLRYPTQGRIMTPQLKTVTLLQAQLNDYIHLEPSLQQECNKVMRVFARSATGLRNIIWYEASSETDSSVNNNAPAPLATKGFSCLVHAIELAKAVSYRLWPDHPLSAIRQLQGISEEFASQLAGAGIVCLNDIEKAGPQKIEKILGRRPPFGNDIFEAAIHVPKYELAAEQLKSTLSQCLEFEFIVRITRACNFDQVALLIGDDSNRVVFKQKLSTSTIEALGQWSQRIVLEFDSSAKKLFASLISFNFLGIDLHINFPIPWPQTFYQGSAISCNSSTLPGLGSSQIHFSNQNIPIAVSPFLTKDQEKKAKLKHKRSPKLKTLTRSAKKSKLLITTILNTDMEHGDAKTSPMFQTNITKFFRATKTIAAKNPVIKSLQDDGFVLKQENMNRTCPDMNQVKFTPTFTASTYYNASESAPAKLLNKFKWNQVMSQKKERQPTTPENLSFMKREENSRLHFKPSQFNENLLQNCSLLNNRDNFLPIASNTCIISSTHELPSIQNTLEPSSNSEVHLFENSADAAVIHYDGNQKGNYASRSYLSNINIATASEERFRTPTGRPGDVIIMNLNESLSPIFAPVDMDASLVSKFENESTPIMRKSLESNSFSHSSNPVTLKSLLKTSFTTPIASSSSFITEPLRMKVSPTILSNSKSKTSAIFDSNLGFSSVLRNCSPLSIKLECKKMKPESNVYKTVECLNENEMHDTLQSLNQLYESPNFHTPQKMRLVTSLDDFANSQPDKNSQTVNLLHVFRIPTTPMKPKNSVSRSSCFEIHAQELSFFDPLEQSVSDNKIKVQSALITPNNKSLTENSPLTKMSKRVSFGHFFSNMASKSPSGLTQPSYSDTGYSTYLTNSPKPRPVNVSMTSKASYPIQEIKLIQPHNLLTKPMNPEPQWNKMLQPSREPISHPLREMDFDLVRSGWDELASFLYCYNLLKKFDAEESTFVAISAPKTPPHNTDDMDNTSFFDTSARGPTSKCYPIRNISIDSTPERRSGNYKRMMEDQMEE